MKSNLLYGIIAISKTRVRCIFCRVNIPKAKKCIDQHTNGAKHLDIIFLMNANCISLTNEAVFCKPCKLTFTEKDTIMNHIKSDDHANWINAVEDLIDGEFIDLNHYLTSDKDQIYCQVCKMKFSGSLAGVEEHVNLFYHRAKVADRLKPLNGIFRMRTDEKVWCRVCEVYIENTVQSILDHIDNDLQHAIWFTEVNDLIDNHDISIKNYLSNMYETNAFCNKCNIQISCNIDSLESHVNSDLHLRKCSL